MFVPCYTPRVIPDLAAAPERWMRNPELRIGLPEDQTRYARICIQYRGRLMV